MQLTSPLPTQSQPRPIWQKQMPTLLGLGVLIIALVAGLVMFGSSTYFSPRATAQTTPKQVKITNVGDKAFTVSFYTDEATAGFVKYGLEASSLKTQASDDRDQLAGSVSQFTLHHITIKGLKPNTTYFFTLGTGSGTAFDNNGAPFTIKTAPDPGTPPPTAKTVYGNVMSAGGTPAEGSVVYLVAEGGGELSALVKSSGSWAVSLANARTSDGINYLALTDETALTIFVQGTSLSQTVKLVTKVKDAQPLADMTLAANGTVAEITPQPTIEVASDSATPTATPEPTLQPTSTVSPSPTLTPTTAPATDSAKAKTSTASASLTASPSAKPTTVAVATTATPSAVLDLSTLGASGTAVSVTKPLVEAPKIVGVAAPAVPVKISIHSQTEINQTVTADANGNFEIDVSQFQNLEPGEHTVTYSYTDPTTGKEVTKTHTFTVAAPKQTAMAKTTPTPTTKKASSSATTFGSGNPYPITSPTKKVDTSTRSAVVSTTSGTFKSGSVGETIALIGGGFFLVTIGWWSWWLAGQVKEETA